MKLFKVEVKKVSFKDVMRNFWIACFVALLWVNFKKYLGIQTSMTDFLGLLGMCFWGGVASGLGFSFYKNPVATLAVLLVPFFIIQRIIILLHFG